MKKTNKNPERIETSVRNKFSDYLITGLFLLMIFGFGIAIYIIPQKNFSEEENRSLQTFPSYSSVEKFVDELVDGRLGEDITKFYSDQFPLRNYFVGIKAFNERLLLKKENNDVVFAKDGYLINRFDYSNEELLKTNLSKIDKGLSSSAAPVYTIIPPRTQDVILSKLPNGYPTELSDGLYERLEDYLSEKSFHYIDLRALLVEADKEGDDVYYKTDHHWTSKGANIVYNALSDAIGFVPESEFAVETVSDEFYGTSWSSAGAKWISPDAIQKYVCADDDSYVLEVMKYSDISKLTGIEDDISATIRGFYDESALDKKDKYLYFLGGNYALAKLYKETDIKRPKILLVKDSFANSLVPFLARNYDIDLVDPRYYTGIISDIVEGSDYEFILCCINMDILTTQAIKIN